MSVLETPDLPDSRVCCLFAKTGHGKTSVSLDRLARFDRWLAIDTKAKHTGIPEYPGMAVNSAKELQDLLNKWWNRPRWGISYRGPVLVPNDPKRPQAGRNAEAFFAALARIPNFLLIVEEAEAYMTASSMPDGLFDIVRQGRTMGQAVTVCAHRPADVARNLTAVADAIFAWPTEEPNDRAVLQARGFDLGILDSLNGYHSLRMVTPEGKRRRFHLCRCDRPHAGVCGPAYRPPRKVETDASAPAA